MRLDSEKQPRQRPAHCTQGGARARRRKGRGRLCPGPAGQPRRGWWLPAAGLPVAHCSWANLPECQCNAAAGSRYVYEAVLAVTMRQLLQCNWKVGVCYITH